MSNVDFRVKNTCIWLNLDGNGIWMLVMLVACKLILYKFYLNEWVIENLICDHNDGFD